MSARGAHFGSSQSSGGDRDQPVRAVLTGDVVGSTQGAATVATEVSSVLGQSAEALRKALPDAGISAIDVFRGDSWQLLVSDAREALRAALLFRTFLIGGDARGGRSWDTRVGIGVGSVDSVNAERISQSQGAAFIASGQALDEVTNAKRRLGSYGMNGEDYSTADTMLHLIDAIACRWTARQAWALNGALRGLTQEEIGRGFVPPLQQRTVADHLQRADWYAIEAAVEWWRKEWS